MSPLEINLLLHIYAIAEPFNHPDEPIYQKIKDKFVYQGLTEINPDKACGYSLRPQGYALVKMLTNTPLPVEKEVFVDPRTNEVVWP